MTYEWPFVRKTFLWGLAMTVVGVFLVIAIGWDEATLLWLGIGSLFLVCSIMLALGYVILARHGTSHLPEDWETLSFEEKQEFARKRLREQKSRSSRAALWVMQMNDPQRQKVKGFL